MAAQKTLVREESMPAREKRLSFDHTVIPQTLSRAKPTSEVYQHKDRI